MSNRAWPYPTRSGRHVGSSQKARLWPGWHAERATGDPEMNGCFFLGTAALAAENGEIIAEAPATSVDTLQAVCVFLGV